MKKFNTKLGEINPLRLVLMFVLAGFMTTFVGCSDDGGDEENPLVGVYMLSSASLTEATADEVILPDSTEGMILPAGMPVTALVGSILSNASPCNDPTNTAIQLENSGKLLYTCQGENVDAEETGTWSANEENSTLSMVISSEALGGTLPVNVLDYSITGTKLTGKIEGFPFLKNFNEPLGPMNLLTVKVDVEFTKVQ